MTLYDAAMVGVVIAGMVWGALRGITWQVASIASLVLGYAVAYPLSGELAPRFPGEPIVARALALLAVYVAVSGGVFLAAWLVRATLRRWKFEAFDRHLGMVLGGAEGALVGVVATLFVVSLAPGTRETILTSPSGRVVGGVLGAARPILPGEVRGMLSDFWGEGADVAIGEEWADDASSLGATLRGSGSRLGHAMVDALADELDRAGDPPGRRAAERSEDGSVLRGRFQEEKSRLGRAVADAVTRELEGASDGHDRGRTTRRR